MAKMHIRRSLLSAISLLLVLASPEPACSSSSSPDVHHGRRYDSIFSFGDSFTDTGNNPAVFAWYSVFDPVTRPPYGTTFFGRPTGRNCDGRLILDFIAERLGVPYLPPYLGPPFASPSPANNSAFLQGASFAVGAATALDVQFLRERDIPGGPSKFPFNTSLGVQLEWFESLKPSLCRTTQGCREVLGRSLFLVGELGVNDYHFSLQRKSVPEIRSYVPNVVRSITMAIERLMNHGAMTLVVPGVIPSGCSPPVLAMFPDAAPREYDSRTGCLKAPNELGLYHNALLQQSLEKLRARHPNATIIYADFFSPVMEMVESPHKFGFRKDVLTVCCGGPGRNNFNGSVPCGDPKATTCSDPSASLYWDGVHFTEAANRYIAGTWLSSIDHDHESTIHLVAAGREQSKRHGQVHLALRCHRLTPPPLVVGARRRLLPLRARRYDSIFSFGDSFADTGNNPVVFDWYSVFNPVTRPPYGSTFFGRPTGRNCDGRLIIDFLAESLGLPLVPPFLAHNGTFHRGANFAVGGATAIDAGFFHRGEPTGASKFPLNVSLAVQLQWFESLKPSLCSNIQGCRELFSRSLFFVGEFGFNDYSFLLGGRSVQQVRSLVPDVIATISMATERLIGHGATSLVVPGVLPAGCAPPILVMLQEAADPGAYDSGTGCLTEINELSTYHNSLLRQALHNIQAKHPHVEIIYADFFSPVMKMVESPAKFGFEGDVLTICCGGPANKYHFDVEAWCGDPGATQCKDPSTRLFWDGVHLTEAANRYIAGDWLSSINSIATATSQ